MSTIQIPGYKIINQLDRGGMATVYLAEQLVFGRLVALKILTSSHAENELFGIRFLREARIAAHLSHPNIVSVFDTGTVDGNYFLSMEYLPGGDLRDRIKSGVALLETLEIVAAMAEAVDYASNAGVIHRDIKPGNVMFRADGSLAMVDFGIARDVYAETEVTQAGTVLGTPHYMSPEQCLGEELDLRSDLYSVGIVFYEMLSGNVPFSAESSAAVGVQHVSAKVPPLPLELSVFQDIIDKALAKNPDERYQTGAEFSADLDAKRGELPLELQTTVLANNLQPRPGETPYPRIRGTKSRSRGAGTLRGNRPVQEKSPVSKVANATGGLALILALAGGLYWYLSHNLNQSSGSTTSPANPDIPATPASVVAPPPDNTEKAESLALARGYVDKARMALSEGLIESAGRYIDLAKSLEIDSPEVRESLAEIFTDRERMLVQRKRLDGLVDNFEKLFEAGAVYSPAMANAYSTLGEIRLLDPRYPQLADMQSRIETAAGKSIRLLIARNKLDQAEKQIKLLGNAGGETLASQLMVELDVMNKKNESMRKRLDQLHEEARSLATRTDNDIEARHKLVTTYQRILELDNGNSRARAGLATTLTIELERARQDIRAGDTAQARETLVYLESNAPNLIGLKATREELLALELKRSSAESAREEAVKILEKLNGDFRANSSSQFHRNQAEQLINAYQAIFRAEKLDSSLPGIQAVVNRIDKAYSDRFFAYANRSGIEVAIIYAEVLSNSGLNSVNTNSLVTEFSTTMESVVKKRQGAFHTF